MAMYPALIAGYARTAKPWREVGPVAPAVPEPIADAVSKVPEPALEMAAELRSMGRLAHRLATVFGTVSVALLWATNWLSSAAKVASIPAVPLGVAASVLGVVFAVLAFGLEVLTRVRLERAPELTTLQEHRKRIEAESAAFRESLPAVEPEREHRPPVRRGRLGRQLRNRRG